ncbi:hypothetical protein C482_03476 [Natrialba chahannaoensis JCM 10990]|uniref:Uncharacterized protein n=1 Tax=Natrialba chahannaoensis JCM 10990 TaxID=1227492 RepID=M0AZJ5_9EURY|nr:hypothetical protein C482_03476 [Natrialba chahannaoensis JCM 10990]
MDRGRVDDGSLPDRVCEKENSQQQARGRQIKPVGVPKVGQQYRIDHSDAHREDPATREREQDRPAAVFAECNDCLENAVKERDGSGTTWPYDSSTTN